MESLVGRSLGRYAIRRLLGEGGMGAVFQAHDTTLQRDVAIKVMHPHLARQPDFLERFLLEARTAAHLDHPNIVPVYDFGQEGSLLFIVMKLIPGNDLHKLLKDMRAASRWIFLPEAIGIVRHISLALDYVHRQGVLHRDIKPGNIMLEPEPTADLPYRPVLTDLGLANLLDGQAITREGTSVGTPAYMSPELALGRPTDARSDVYSLGVLLYELAVGQLPFPAQTITEAIRYHTQEPPPPPRSINPEFPKPLEKIILQTLAKEPAERFPTAAALAQALEEFVAEEAAAPAPLLPASEPSLASQHQQSLVQPPPEPEAASPGPGTLPCPHCGAEHQPEDQVCLDCGAALLQLEGVPPPMTPPPMTPPPPPRPQPPPARRPPGWVWAVVGAAGIALVMVLVLLVGPLLWGTRGAVIPTSPTLSAYQESTTEPAPTAPPATTAATTLPPVVQPTMEPPPPTAPTATPTVPTATPVPTTTPTPTCPPVPAPFAAVWQAQQDALGCATSDAATHQMAREQMERGLMIWRSDDQSILVLYGTGTSGPWARYEDTWNEGDPEYSCPAIAPSESPPTPRRGFGKVWCTQADVRDGLGWATEYEDEFYGQVQSFQRGFLLRNDESGEILIFLNDGAWLRP